MSISTDASDLWQEIQGAEEERNKCLGALDQMIQRYHGPFYKSDEVERQFFPENAYFDYMQTNLSEVIYDNPEFLVTSKRGGAAEEVAEAMRFALNRWAKDQDLQEELTHVCADMFFAWGVTMMSLEVGAGEKLKDKWELTEEGFSRVPGPERSRRIPRLFRISPRRFFMDPMCLKPNEARYMGHMWVRSRKEILKEAERHPERGWDKRALELLESNGASALSQDLPERENKQAPDRDEIKGYDIWLPGEEAEGELGHGRIYTLIDGEGISEDNKPMFLRAPRDWYGPPTGPYTVYGVFPVMDQPYPISPLVAFEGQIRETNKHAKALSKNAAERKKVGLYDQLQAKDAEKIRDAKDGWLVGIKNLANSPVQEIEYGGISKEQLAWYEILLQRMHKATGLVDVRRGLANDGTATANAIADQAIEAQIGYVKKRFRKHVAADASKAGWWFWYEEDVLIPLGPEAGAELGMADPVFIGGQSSAVPGLSYEDLELDVEPMSMERSSGGLRGLQVTELFQLVSSVMPVVAQTPYWDWKTFFDMLGEARNIPGLGDLLNQQLAGAMLGMQQTAQGGQGPPARTTGDLGAAGVAGRAMSGPVARVGGGAGQMAAKGVGR